MGMVDSYRLERWQGNYMLYNMLARILHPFWRSELTTLPLCVPINYEAFSYCPRLHSC
jgi:hypothetical protein